jgi:hypothetical protein
MRTPCRPKDVLLHVAQAVSVAVAVLVSGSSQAAADSIILGSSGNFAILGASAVTNTGPTTINGNVGVYPGSSITGTGTITLLGASMIDNTPPGTDPVSQQAQFDASNAYSSLVTSPVTQDLTGHDLGTSGTLPIGVLDAGVYMFSSSAQLNDTLTLDAQGNPNAMFVFEIGSTLTTASASSVNVINGGSNVGVYWLVGSSATIGTTTAFEGNILAVASITLNTGATILCGRALALNGAVTMDSNTISNNCSAFGGDTSATDFGSNGFSGSGVSANIGTPEPGTVGLFGIGVLGLIALWFRRQRSLRRVTCC